MEQSLIFTVSEFIAVLNQTLEYAYPNVTVRGELTNYKVSKGRWVYFDLKDEQATVRFFGTVYQLPGPLEDGMLLEVRGVPRLHPQYGFSVTIQHIRPSGEGSIKKAAKLLEAKLAAEGLFDEQRKRSLPYPPSSIGVITSLESAAYRDFVKVIGARWGGIEITVIDVQVQGEPAITQIIEAVDHFNQLAVPPEVLVVTRGGGSTDDLQVFSTEQVTRAIAASRIPTLVAIGHEIDVSLAELAADKRASTPSNAAELLVPDRKALKALLQRQREELAHYTERSLHETQRKLATHSEMLQTGLLQLMSEARQKLHLQEQLVMAFDPRAVLKRGYALIRQGGAYIRSGHSVKQGGIVEIELTDACITADVKRIIMTEEK